MLIDYKYTTRDTLLYTYFDEQNTHCTEKDKRRNAHFTSHFFNSFRFDLFKRFRRPLARMIKQLQLYFPRAQIVFKSVLPIGIMHTYTTDCILKFNSLLYALCSEFNLLYLDCFCEFLDEWGFDIDRKLYRDRIHVNEMGLKILCRAIKYIIYNNVHNPYLKVDVF